MQRQAQDGLVWYESKALNLLGLKHGFYTNRGGYSKDEFTSLNVKLGIGDDGKNVIQNRQLIKDSLDYKALVFSNHLPHEAAMNWTEEVRSQDPAVDALATSTPNLALGLSTADCLPIIVSDGRIVTIIHAGWRGTVMRIVEKTISDLVEKHRLDLQKAAAACGPCICKQHFEVKGEAARELRLLHGRQPLENSFHADLLELNIKQLASVGIKNIDLLNICTVESDDFYSYRQSGGVTGRNMTVALLHESAPEQLKNQQS